MYNIADNPDFQKAFRKVIEGVDLGYNKFRILCHGAKHRSPALVHLFCLWFDMAFPDCNIVYCNHYVDTKYSKYCKCPEECRQAGADWKTWYDGHATEAYVVAGWKCRDVLAAM